MKKKLILFLMTLLVSCSYHESYMEPDSDGQIMDIILSPLDAAESATRSVINASGIENKISHATIAVYDSATKSLVGSVYSTSNFSLTLATGKTYNIYVIANMGDVRSSLPSDEHYMKSLKLTMPSYTTMNSRGLPMAQMVTTAWTRRLPIELRRLMAKVNITIDHSDMDSGGSDKSFSNTQIKVHRAVKRICPFESGGNAAESTSDINSSVADYQTVSDGYADVSETLTLYIPENMQGNFISGNKDPWNKSESNSSLNASLCTYISFEGIKDGSVDGVEGDFEYRFFPGGNDIRNFDLQGNRIYDISLVLTWDGMYVEDNWKVEKSNWSDSRRIMVSTSEDSGYTSNARLYVARGTVNAPVYIYYAPHGMSYESETSGGEAHHFDKGWVFSPENSLSGGTAATAPRANNLEFTGTYMSTGFIGHGKYRTLHYVTVPATTPVGYTNRIIYETVDGRKSAWLDIVVVEATELSVSLEEEDGGGDIEY